MPARVIDGDAVSRSKKLRRVAERWRVHYPYWLTLAEVHGVFEAVPEIIHGKLYPTGFMPGLTVKDVATILREFISADLVRTWQARGSRWGIFVGQGKPGRLVSVSEMARYRADRLPPAPPIRFLQAFYSKELADFISVRFIDTQRGSSVGEGVGLGEGSGTGIGAASGGHEDKKSMIQKRQTQRRLGHILATTWQEVKGSAGAVCPYPRGGFQVSFESLAENHDDEVIIDAFKLWAKDVGDPDRISFPIEEFMKEAASYMLKARPPVAPPEDPEAAKKREEQARRQSEFETKAGGLLDGMRPRPDEGPAVTDLSLLD